MFFGDETNFFVKDDKKPNIPLRQHYSHQEKKYKKFEYTPINANKNLLSKRKKSNKRVKFNDKVEVILVESYKKYNYIEENGINYQEYLQRYKNYYEIERRNDNKKRCGDCSCHII